MDFVQGNRACKMRIARLILQQTGTYNNQYLRPYDVTMDGQTINNICNRIQDVGATKLSGNLIAGIAGASIAPTAAAQAEIFIPNNFNEARVRFVLAVEVEYTGGPGMLGSGTKLMYYFQGYTDHPGITVNGAIDDRMMFYINSFIGVSRIQTMTAFGTQQRDMIVEQSQMLSDPNWAAHMSNGTPYMSMRPYDVFGGIQREYMNTGYEYGQPNAGLQDTRNQLAADSLVSGRANNLPATYMANVIDSYTMSCRSADFAMDDTTVLGQARQRTLESAPGENPFIRAINSQSQMAAGNHFTLNTLRHIDPNVDNVTDVNILTGAAVQQVHQTGQTAYWNASDRLTQAASMLAQAVPAIMIELMVSRISIFSHNHDVTGRMDTRVAGASSLTGADISMNLALFVRRLEEEVLFYMTYGNQDRYTLNMTADMFGETSIVISIGNEPETPYVVPSFCDNLFAPVVTASRENYNQVVAGFDSLVRNVSEAVTPRTPNTVISNVI